MLWDNWTARWETAIGACNRLGGETENLLVLEPANDNAVNLVQRELGFNIPDSFRSVLLGFAGQVELYWSLPEDAKPPNELRQIFTGNCSWNLSALAEMNTKHEEIVQLYFSDITDPAQKLWHNKFVFLQVQDGARLVIDLDTSGTQPVVYLDPFRGQGNGYPLGESFADFIDRWSLLGCPGPEIVQMLPFTSSTRSGLDPYGISAQTWRSWFGITV